MEKSEEIEKKKSKERARNARKRRCKRVTAYKNSLKRNGCSLCGYKKCIKAIEFHHVNGKDANIGGLSSIKKINDELLKHKIVLLCSNCHREVHSNKVKAQILTRVVPIQNKVKKTTTITTKQKILGLEWNAASIWRIFKKAWYVINKKESKNGKFKSV